MDVFIAFAVFLLSLALTSFTIVPILIILRVGFPVTKRCDEERMFIRGGAKAIRNRYRISILILAAMFIIPTLLTYFVFDSYTIAFSLGAIWAILSAVRKTGIKINNLADYREVNSRYFTNTGLEAFQRPMAREISHHAHNILNHNSKGVL